MNEQTNFTRRFRINNNWRAASKCLSPPKLAAYKKENIENTKMTDGTKITNQSNKIHRKLQRKENSTKLAALTGQTKGNLQCEGLVPDRIEVCFDRFRLLFGLDCVRRDELKLDVRIG